LCCPWHTSDHFLVPLGSQLAYDFIATTFVTIPQKMRENTHELAQTVFWEDQKMKYDISLRTEKRFCSFTIFRQIKPIIWNK